MTVCIAAISHGMVFLAADRMLSNSESSFEPATQKIVGITTSIAALFSGDPGLHAEVGMELSIDVRARIDRAPDEWLRVREVADLYAKHWQQVRRKRAEAAILSPLGMTVETFMTNQQSMDSALVRRVAQELLDFRLPALQVIIAGVDLRLGHALPSIYEVQDGKISSADGVGFAAIGSGARHAHSRFMLAGHSAQASIAEALFHLYSAKRDAEIAPTVGTESDFYFIGPGVGSADRLSDVLVKKIDSEYRKSKKAEVRVRERAKGEMRAYIDAMLKRANESKPEPPQAAGPAISSSDQT